VGRQAELVEVGRLLEDPAVRLVTLVGLGGWARRGWRWKQARRRSTGVAWSRGVLGLVGTREQPERDGPAIAEALGLRFREGSEPRQQLLSYLREKQMLLILDNLEHLVAGVDLLTDILGAAAGVRVLTTSRVRLGLPEEHAFPWAVWICLIGRFIRQRCPWRPRRTRVTSSRPMQASAVKLFLQSAPRWIPGLSWRPAICTP